MQKLIQLLSQQLEIQLTQIKGEEIIKSHILHVHRFLQVLEKFSEHYLTNTLKDSGSRRAKSDPNTSQRIDEKVVLPRSARQKIPKNIPNEGEQNPQKKDSTQILKNQKNPNNTYHRDRRQSRSRQQINKNLYGSLITIMAKQKNKTMVASSRDNRKIKNIQIIQAKNKYRSYLINYTKQNRAKKNRDNLIKNKKQNYAQRHLDVHDIFKSFQYKLRDKKYCYLKKIQKLIKQQEIDRMCYFNKIEHQKNNYITKQTKKQLTRIQNQHRIRNSVLKQQYENSKQTNKIMKKQYQKYLRIQKRQIFDTKKKQLKKINNFVQEQNQKILFKLQHDGQLEKIIMNLYKKF